MNKSGMDGSGGPHGAGPNIYYGPVLIILALLVGWLLATNWDRLPQAIASAMAALP